MKQYFYGFEKTKKAVYNLSRKIKRSKFKPKTLVALARGGLLIGLWLSHKLNVPLMILSVKSYDDLGNQGSTVLMNTSYTVPLQSPILIIDEVCDKGLTLNVVKNHFESIGVGVKTATLLYKPHSIIKPNWSVEQVNNETWVTFFWEK